MQPLRGQLARPLTTGYTILSILAQEQWLQPGALQLLQQQRLCLLHTHNSRSLQFQQLAGSSSQLADNPERQGIPRAQHTAEQGPNSWQGSFAAANGTSDTRQSGWTAAAANSYQRSNSSSTSRISRSWSLGQQHLPGAGKQAQQQEQNHQNQQHQRPRQQLTGPPHHSQTTPSAAQPAALQYLRAAKRAKFSDAAHTSVAQLQLDLSKLLSNLAGSSLDSIAVALQRFNRAGLPVPPDELQRVLQHFAGHAAACRPQHIQAAALAVVAAQDSRSQQLLQPLAARALQLRIAQLKHIDGHQDHQQQLQNQQERKELTQSQHQLQHEAALPPSELNQVLWLHEVAAQLPVPQQQMQQLLLHAAATATQYTQQQLLRVLFHARHTGLPAHAVPPELLDRACSLLLQQLPEATPVAVCSVLHALEYSGRVMPQQQLQQLVDQVLANIASCEGKHAVRVLRSAGFAGLQLQQEHLHVLLELLTTSGRTTNPSQQASLIALAVKAVSHMGQQIEQRELERLVQCVLDAADPKQGLAPKQASSILKSITCMGQMLPKQLLSPLLKPLQFEASQKHRSLEHLGTLLLTLKSSIDAAPKLQQQLLNKAVAALQREATAARHSNRPGKVSSAPSTIQDQRDASSPARNSKQSTRGQRMSAASIAELLRALNVHAVALPAQLAVPLTSSFLSKEPTAREIAMYVAAFGAMYLAPDLFQATAMMQQVQQQVAQLTAADVGMLLWGLANMGYSLEPELLQLLLQQLLQQAKLPTAYQFAQSLWAVANMGSSDEQAQQHGIPADLMQQLLQKLYHATLQERRLSSSSSSSSSSASTSTGTEQPATATMHWHVSVAAWAAALCNARSCEREVLQLCSLLADPASWSALRTSELVQLSWAHMWLCNYVWSDTGGLAACLSAEQLQAIKTARRGQIASIASVASHLGSGLLQEQQQGIAGAHALSPGSIPVASSSSSSSGMMGSLGQSQMLPLPPRVQRRKAMASGGPSASQERLFRVVRSLPTIASASLEGVTPDGLFSVDVEATTTDGHLLAIEFDGPHHFATNVPVGCSSKTTAASDASCAAVHVASTHATTHLARRMIGRPWLTKTHLKAAPAQPEASQEVVQLARKHTTRFRDRVLAAYGYTVVTMPYYDWTDRGPFPVKQQQVQQLVQNALDGKCH